jgi:hypothetical protein
MAGKFDRATLDLLRKAAEVRIHAGKQSARGVVIWAVVVGDDVFIRSVQGPKGKWYQSAVANGQATLEADHRTISARAVPVGDAATIAAVSDAYLAKYEPSPWAKAMVQDEVLPTTLRLEPA